MKIKLLARADEDLMAGYNFYEAQSPGLGSYFLDSPFSDIESLLLYAGVHRVVHGSHRCLSKRFPYAIYYRVKDDEIQVRAIFDCRRHPSIARQRLQHP